MKDKKYISYHFFNLRVLHTFEDEQGYINYNILNYLKLMISYHVIIGYIIEYCMTIIELMDNHKISFCYIASFKYNVSLFNIIQGVICYTHVYSFNQGVS